MSFDRKRRRQRKVRVLAIHLALTAVIAGCGQNAGTIKTPTTAWQVNQLQEDDVELVFSTPIGWQRIPLGAQAGDQSPAVILDQRYSVLAVDAAGKTWVLGDSATNLYVWRRGEDPAPVEIKALRGRTGAVAVSWSANLAVAARHADFSRPQAEWAFDEDDRLFLVDLRTRQVQAIEAEHRQLVQGLAWEASTGVGHPPLLYVDLASTAKKPASTYRVDVVTKERTLVDAFPDAVANGRSRGVAPACPMGASLEADDDGIALRGSEKSDEGERLVILEGRKRGFHDYQPTFTDVRLGPSCKLVYFVFRRSLYTVTVERPHRVAELAGGDTPLFFDADRKTSIAR